MATYIYIDDNLNPRWMKDVAGRIIDFSQDSIALAIKLVLTRTSEIEKNKVYGPFDVPTYSRGELKSFLKHAQSTEEGTGTLNTTNEKPRRYWTREEFEFFLKEEGFI
jgi:hypothetical protein